MRINVMVGEEDHKLGDKRERGACPNCGVMRYDIWESYPVYAPEEGWRSDNHESGGNNVTCIRNLHGRIEKLEATVEMLTTRARPIPARQIVLERLK